MDVIIVGLGSVGINLTKTLSEEGHNVIVIDTDNNRVDDAVNRYDVTGVVGNCVSHSVLKEARVSDTDVLIAATSQDELNILCCIIAKRLGVNKTISRISKNDYFELYDSDNELGISLMVNPQYETAMEIIRILRFPSAIKVDQFSEGKVELVEFKITADSELVGVQLNKLSDVVKNRVLICAVERGETAIIPDGNFVIEAEDRLYVTAVKKQISAFFKELGLSGKTRKILIVGGSRTAMYLCQNLDKYGFSTKIIEKDPEKSRELSESLAHTEVILGDGTNQTLLLEEGINTADAFVALGDSDEQNIIMSMFALSNKVKKVITKIDQISYFKMLQNSGIDSVVSTKNATADQIIRFVRTIGNTKGSQVKSLFHIINDKAEALEFSVDNNFKGSGVTLSQLELKKNLLIAGIFRDNVLITPSGKDTIEKGDSVIVVTLNEGLDDLNDILN